MDLGLHLYSLPKSALMYTSKNLWLDLVSLILIEDNDFSASHDTLFMIDMNIVVYLIP